MVDVSCPKTTVLSLAQTDFLGEGSQVGVKSEMRLAEVAGVIHSLCYHALERYWLYRGLRLRGLETQVMSAEIAKIGLVFDHLRADHVAGPELVCRWTLSHGSFSAVSEVQGKSIQDHAFDSSQDRQAVKPNELSR